MRDAPPAYPDSNRVAKYKILVLQRLQATARLAGGASRTQTYRPLHNTNHAPSPLEPTSQHGINLRVIRELEVVDAAKARDVVDL